MTVWVPPGWHIAETNEVVTDDDSLVHIHWLKRAAVNHCKKLNEQRTAPTFRYEVEPASPEFKRYCRKKMGPIKWLFSWPVFIRWLIVPYQNVLEMDR